MSNVRLYESDREAWLECVKAAAAIECARFASVPEHELSAGTVAIVADALFAEYKARLQATIGR